MPTTEPDLGSLVASLTPDERARLPARLRALVADERAAAWAQAKAERDAAMEVAYALDDLDERAAALTVANDAWQACKAKLEG